MDKTKPIRTRKRISRAGSGGYSIYLPKQWIKGWTEEQSKGKEVEMFTVGDQLVLSPTLSRRTARTKAGVLSKYELKQYIVSAYVNGADDFALSSDHLSESLIGESRNIIRLLDENLVPGSTNNEVSYSNRSDITHDTDALLTLLFDNVIEYENIAVDLLGCFDINPRKGVQLLRLMYTLEEEDIDRISFQLLRQLSRCDPSSKTLPDLVVKWMTADTLERIGDNLYAIAGLLCGAYGLEKDKLQYPVEYLQETALKETFSMPRNVEGLKTHAVSDITVSSQMLSRVKDILLAKDGKAATAYSNEMNEYRQRREKEFWGKTGRLPPLSYEAQQCVFLCNMIEARIREIMYLTEGLAKRAGLMYFAEKA